MAMRHRRHVSEPRRARREERGAVVVEFALIAPMLLLLVFGLIDFGWMIERGNVINNVTRDAARVASLGGTYDQISTTVTTELADYGITTASAATPGKATVAITCTNTSGSNCDGTQSSYTANATSGSAVKVRVIYTHRWITPIGAMCQFFGGSCVGNTIAIARTSEMVRE